MQELVCESPSVLWAGQGMNVPEAMEPEQDTRGFRYARLRAELHARRIAEKLTLQEVSERSGGVVSVSQLSRIERGDITTPSFYDVAAVAHILGMTGNDVFRIVGFDRGEGGNDPRLEQAMQEIMGLPNEQREMLISAVSNLVVGVRYARQFDAQNAD